MSKHQIGPFRKRIVTQDEKWIKRKRSRANRIEPTQTLTKPRLTIRKVLFSVFGRKLSTMSCSTTTKFWIRTDTVNSYTAWRKNNPKWPIREELCYCRTAPDHTNRKWLARSSGTLIAEFLCIHLIARIWHQVITTFSNYGEWFCW